MHDESIKLENIAKVYHMGAIDTIALKGISLSINKGEMAAIMGPSGSGKSTLLNILGCLDKPDQGTYYLDGADVSQLNKEQLAAIRGRKIGFIFQGFNLLSNLSVLANTQLPMVYTGAGKKEMLNKAMEALNWVGLGDYTRHKPNQMSGGQQQRVAIARSLVNNPSIILADEPTGALDSKTSLEIMAVLQRLNTEKSITMVIITHDIDVAHYCRRIINIKDGALISDSPVVYPKNAAEDLSAIAIALPAERSAG